ncbi:hypothetical protein FRUB_06182 [Fimbriiglobus ruber]|uniref:RNA polymerase sigma factor RpoE n=1 Tax=Fimbriiglobus ruber TaxID=1908690 RepID=A0A225DBY3_9BACT|nr:hypothetical protein FRUB_06182 [Fimbriiglobus ruber]
MLSDAELLARFGGTRDEAAFEEILRRYGPLVWGVCRRVLAHQADTEDAFQATFLVLAKRAGAVRKPGALGCWLYGVAYRVARRMRGRKTPIPLDPGAPGATAEPAPDAVSAREFLAALDEELLRLPARYRAALVHCFLREETQDEAARNLNVSLSTLKRRVAAGREILRSRLSGRGVDLSAVLIGVGVAGTGGSGRAGAAVLAAVRAGAGAGEFVSPTVINLAEGVVNTMWQTKLRAWATGLAMAAVATGGSGYFAYTGFGRDDPTAVKPGGLPAADEKPNPKPKPDPRVTDPTRPGGLPAAEKWAADLTTTADTHQLRLEKLKIAHDALALQVEMVKRGVVPSRSRDMYEWSKRVLQAEQELDPSSPSTLAAARDHFDRMKTSEVTWERLVKSGAVSLEESRAAAYQRVEAEIWLREAEARAARSDARPRAAPGGYVASVQKRSGDTMTFFPAAGAAIQKGEELLVVRVDGSGTRPLGKLTVTEVTSTGGTGKYEAAAKGPDVPPDRGDWILRPGQAPAKNDE